MTDRTNPIDPELRQLLLGEVQNRISDLENRATARKRRSSRRAMAAAGVMFVVVAGVGGARTYDYWDRARIETRADAAIAALPELAGYPLKVSVADGAITAEGLAPTQEAHTRLAAALNDIAKAEGRTLRLIVGLPVAAGAVSGPSRGGNLEANLRAEITPLSASIADTAIRVHDLETLLAERDASAAAQQDELTALRAEIAAARATLDAAIDATSKDRSDRAATFDRRLTIIQDNAAVLAAEIRAIERVAERRADRLTISQLDAGAAIRANLADILAKATETTDAAGKERSTLSALLEEQASKTASQTTALAVAIAANTDLVNQNIAGTEALKADTNGRLTQLIASFETNATKASESEASMGETVEKFDRRLGAALSRLEALDGRIADALARIVLIEAASADKAPIAKNAERLENLSELTTSLGQDVKRLKTGLTAQIAATEHMQSELAGLQVKIGAATTAATKVAAQNYMATADIASPNVISLDPKLANRLQALESRAAEAIAILDQRIDRIAQEAQPRAASPLQALQRQLAPLNIRFASAAQPADPKAAGKILANAAELALAMPDGARLRIVGYADSDGTTEANRITSKRRSDWVLNELARVGVPPDRMVSVGRGAERLLSPSASDDSPNRRVEFEAF